MSVEVSQSSAETGKASEGQHDLADQVEQLLAQMERPEKDADPGAMSEQDEFAFAAEEMCRDSEQHAEDVSVSQPDAGSTVHTGSTPEPPVFPESEPSNAVAACEDSLAALVDEVNQILQESTQTAPPDPQPVPAVTDPAPPRSSPAASPTDLNALDAKLAEMTDDLLAGEVKVPELSGIELDAPRPAPNAVVGSVSREAAKIELAIAPDTPEAVADAEPITRRIIRRSAQCAEKFSPHVAAALSVVSKPMQNRPESQRQAVGWLALWTVFMSAILWGFVLFRPPAKQAAAFNSFDFESGRLPPIPNPDDIGSKAKSNKTVSQQEQGDSHAKPPKGEASKSAKSEKSGHAGSSSTWESQGGGH